METTLLMAINLLLSLSVINPVLFLIIGIVMVCINSDGKVLLINIVINPTDLTNLQT